MNVIVVDSQSKDIIVASLNSIDRVNVSFGCDNLNEIKDTKNIDIIFFDIDKNSAPEILKKVIELKNQNHKLNFIATSYEINSELVVEILKTEGVKEFILKPVIKPILENAIKKIEDKINKIPIKKANTVAIYSSSGATGKTSLALNLAYEIATSTKQKTCLLDLNYGDCLNFLNINPKYSPDYIVNNIEKSDENMLLSLLNQCLDSSLYVFCPNNNLKTYNKETLNKVINCLKTFFSYIIIDMPSNIDEKTASLLLNTDMVLLMCTYNLVNLKNCKLALNFLKDIGYDKNRINLIVNRFSLNSPLTIRDVENILNKDVFHKIPNNYITLNDAIERGLPLQITNPNSNIYKAYKALSKEIIDTDFEDLKKNCHNKNFAIYNLIRRMGE